MCLPGIELVPEKHELSCPLQPYQARQQRRRSAGDEQAKANFRKEEARVVRAHCQVAVDHPFEAATHGPAVDGTNHRCWAKDNQSRDVLNLLDVYARLGVGVSLVIL